MLRPSSSECVFRRTYFHKNNICFGGTQHLDIIYSLKILKCQRNLKECSQHRRPKPAAMSSPTAPAHEAVLSRLSTTRWGRLSSVPHPAWLLKGPHKACVQHSGPGQGRLHHSQCPGEQPGSPRAPPSPRRQAPAPRATSVLWGVPKGDENRSMDQRQIPT